MSNKPKHAHFTLDGRPICECSALAYGERFKAAGTPTCDGEIEKQGAYFEALKAEFPGRVRLIAGACPVVLAQGAHGHGGVSPPDRAGPMLDSASIAATILKQRNSYAPHWDKNLFRAMDDSAMAFADALKLADEDRAAFLRACRVQS